MQHLTSEDERERVTLKFTVYMLLFFCVYLGLQFLEIMLTYKLYDKQNDNLKWYAVSSELMIFFIDSVMTVIFLKFSCGQNR
jgi:hypothetical protein